MREAHYARAKERKHSMSPTHSGYAPSVILFDSNISIEKSNASCIRITQARQVLKYADALSLSLVKGKSNRASTERLGLCEA